MKDKRQEIEQKTEDGRIRQGASRASATLTYSLALFLNKISYLRKK